MVNRVCIIDDDEISVYLTSLVIEEAGIAREILPYYSVDKAYEELLFTGDKCVPEVILLDLNMPLKSGWDFLDMLRDREEELLDSTCIFILTSSIAEQDKERSQSYPLVRGFLHKPLEEKSIIQIRSVCASLGGQN